MGKLSKEEEEKKFIEENLSDIKELLELKNEYKQAELKYKNARKSFMSKMNKHGLNMLHVPELSVRIQTSDGMFSTRIDTKLLKKRYPRIYNEVARHRSGDPYIMIYELGKKKKRRKKNNVVK